MPEKKNDYFELNVQEISNQRENNERQPFPHQQEAFRALSKTLTLPISGYKGTLLVLPTGGGKTFTAVNWICRNILASGAKVLWLAQSGYLLDQASDTFINEIDNANGRDTINLRVVSSSAKHANSGSIVLTDDVLICTTQTAISAYSSEQLDWRGNAVRTPFRQFVDNCKSSQLFVVIDEAHHTPAYGCRNLLLALRETIPNLYILGLTATPMHMDQRISGWLKNIFTEWICYEAKKEELQTNKILAVPKYIERKTDVEFEVDDDLFKRLMYKHKDLPENIIDSLAGNQGRNNLIVDDFQKNRTEYGKTLIFADRWYQCEYLVGKLQDLGVRAAAVYSVVADQLADYQGGGRRNDTENQQVMKGFREGKYDVLVNVRMLTEGVDVPDVKTVMVTRQTTSNILLTQMIGRALRGEKAGGGKGKEYANIVFFYDTWKRLLPWAGTDGGLDEGKITQKRNPIELVSIQLIRLAVEDIEYKGFEGAEYLTFIPVGFLVCEYTVSAEEGEEMLTFSENIVAYEFNKDKYLDLIEFLQAQDLTQYSSEDIMEDGLMDFAMELAEKFFDVQKDGFDGQLVSNISIIIRHIAQNGIGPEFIDFHERDLYDLDKIADDLLSTPPLETDILLKNTFNDASLHWGFLYKNFNNFMGAYYKSQQRAIAKRRGTTAAPELQPKESDNPLLTDEIKKQVFIRDNHTCSCCGKKQRKGVILNADHIKAVAMGGNNAISNLQTLCKHCNTVKGVNEINYQVKTTPLNQPKHELKLFEPAGSDCAYNAIARIVNEFYHCGAMCDLHSSERRNGRYYSNWEIVLYAGNDPMWLEPYTNELIQYVQKKFGLGHVREILIMN